LETKSNLISKTRLISQKIASTEFKSPSEIVSWMGAMQAQDYSMAKWAIGSRLKETSDNKIESSYNKGEILRIHLLRPTWHFVSAEDIYWMLQLSSAKIKSSLKTRHAQLELSDPIIAKTTNIIEKSLSKETYLTREELADEFSKAAIRTDENRLSHILFSAEMDGIICSGPLKKNKLTYALLQERVPHKKEYSKDESLAELARRYFISRYPATLADFIWWSNLSVTDARNAVQLIKDDFHSESIGTSVYWVPNSEELMTNKNSVHLLPAYDEFLISYRDRSSSLSEVNNRRTVSDNGIFYPLIVINGQVAGTWKRTIRKNKVIVSVVIFQLPDETILKVIRKKVNAFGRFSGKDTELAINIETSQT
jgi:hypothetical protein